VSAVAGPLGFLWVARPAAPLLCAGAHWVLSSCEAHVRAESGRTQRAFVCRKNSVFDGCRCTSFLCSTDDVGRDALSLPLDLSLSDDVTFVSTRVPWFRRTNLISRCWQPRYDPWKLSSKQTPRAPVQWLYFFPQLHGLILAIFFRPLLVVPGATRVMVLSALTCCSPQVSVGIAVLSLRDCSWCRPGVDWQHAKKRHDSSATGVWYIAARVAPFSGPCLLSFRPYEKTTWWFGVSNGNKPRDGTLQSARHIRRPVSSAF